MKEAQGAFVRQGGENPICARVIPGGTCVDRFEQREVRLVREATAGFGGDLGCLRSMVKPGEGFDMGRGNVRILRDTCGSIAERRSEIRLPRRQPQP